VFDLHIRSRTLRVLFFYLACLQARSELLSAFKRSGAPGGEPACGFGDLVDDETLGHGMNSIHRIITAETSLDFIAIKWG